MDRRNNSFHPNAMRTLETLTPKHFVQRERKRKRPSPLKKKILMERLRRQLLQRLREEREKALEADLQSEHCEKTVNVFHLTDDIDLGDEDELAEIASNVRELVDAVGDVKRMCILRRKDSSEGINTSPITSFVEVEFHRSSSAQSAVKMLNGLVVAGTPIVVTLSSATMSAAETAVEGTVDVVAKDNSNNDAESAVLVLHNLVSDEEAEDEEALLETLNDIRTLCAPYGQALHSLWVEYAQTHCQHYQPLYDELTDDGLHYPLVLLETKSLERAWRIAQSMDAVIVGGVPLSVAVSTHKFSYAQQWRCPLVPLRDVNGFEGYVCGLLVLGFVSEDQIESEDERDEIVQDMQSIVQLVNESYAVQSSIFVNTSPETPSSAEALSPVHLFVTIRGESDLLSFDAYVSLCEQLRSKTVGGAPLHALLAYCLEDSLQNQTALSMEEFNAVSLPVSTAEGHAVLAIANYVTAEDVEDEVVCAFNPESVVLSKRELLQLVDTKCKEIHGAAVDVLDAVTRVSVLFTPTKLSLPSKEHTMCLRFNDRATARDALLYFDDLLLGGERVRAELVDTREVDSSKSLLIIEASKSLKNSTPNAHYAIALEDFEELHSIDCPSPPPTVDVSSSDVTLPKRVYSTARTAPRLEKHCNPEHPIPIATEEINLYIKEFLKLISTFQQRLKEKNPAKVKQKLRFVAGIKQSLSGVKAKKARIVFIAPNTEASEVLDEKLANLIQLAQSKEIPILYCLSKRLLGKCAQMTIKQSVITVFDPDGAYDLFKKIVRFALPPS